MEAVLNGMIKAREVRLIDEKGENVGVISKSDALLKADVLGVDLVQVNDGDVPVCKLVDFKKYKYEQKRKSRENKETKVKWKETQLSLNIGDNDLNTKALMTNKFLDKGHKVKVVLLLRGREIGNPKMGLNLIDKFKDALGDDFKIIKEAKLEGSRIILHLEK